MDHRLATILPRTQYTSDQTVSMDIDIQDPISRIVLTLENDNNPSGANATGHPALCVTKAELVDGSDVLFSLSGKEMQAIDFYDLNRMLPNKIIYLNGMYSETILNMNFGRYLWDEMLALVPTRFRNPQLKVTLDIDGGGDESDDLYLTVLALVFDQKEVSPSGFLLNKEQKTFTLANSSHEYTDLPRDMPYRQLFVRAQRYGTGPEYQIGNLKLTEDNDKRIPVDHSMFQILRNLTQEWMPWVEDILVPGQTSAQYFYNTPCYWPEFQDTQWRSAVATAEASIYVGDGGRFQHDAEASGPNHQILCRGWAPHAVIPLLGKPPEDPANYWDVSALGSLKLDITGGSSVGSSQTCEIITQQYRAG